MKFTFSTKARGSSEPAAWRIPPRLVLVLWLLALGCLATSGASTGTAEAERYRLPYSYRLEKTINREWTFNYFPAENAHTIGCQEPGFDDSTWPAVALPHTWQTYETTGKVHPFIYDAAEKDDSYWWYGWGWYRKHFSMSREHAWQKVFVEFDGVQKYCKVFVNGKLAGDHKGGYSGFSLEITEWVRFGEDNVLAVAVNNRQNDALRIPPMSAGNFDIYGGIYRDARIVIKGGLYIPFQGSAEHEGGTFVTTTNVSNAQATVRVRTWVKNDLGANRCQLRTFIVNAEGRIVQTLRSSKLIGEGELAQFDQLSQPIPNPHLWSPESPYVYKVFSEVYDISDEPPGYEPTGQPPESIRIAGDWLESPLGIREFKWDYENDRLILNGSKVIIHGSNRHQEYPWLGDATPKWLHLLDMRDFKENLNHNFMRTAHYPQDPCIYDFNDRHGIITIEEAPNIKRQKFSDEVQVQQLREMIRRDRNHPSIFFWSMGNETDDAVDSKYALEEDTTRLIHARDIYNDSAGRFVNTTSKNLPLESLLRCTIRGWYNSDVRDLEPDSAQQAGTETWQHDRNALEIIKRNQDRAADDRANLNTWLYEDHGCDREYANAPLKHVNPKGFVDAWRTPKYFYYLWQAVYAERPMVFIHPHFWRAQYVGQKKEVVVDSNCDRVELKVNGRSLGTLRPNLAEANVVRFKDVLIEQGTLLAEARKGGQTVTAKVLLSGPAARVALTSNPAALEAALDSVALVRADVVDVRGNHVYGAANTLQWTVTGPATLVGPPVYTSDIAKYEQMEGTMYIDAPAFNIIRSTGKPGEIKVRVLSPGLVSAEITLNATNALPSGKTEILEPPLPETHRQPVAREGKTAARPAAVEQEMQIVAEDLQFKAAGHADYADRVERFLRERNPRIDFAGPEFRATVEAFASLLENNRGNLVRDDFNFVAGFYNDCRGITRQVAALKLPAAFKLALREHYARLIIAQGEARDSGAESRWLAGLPDGKVVVSGPVPAPDSPDVLRAERPDLAAMVTLAQPGFAALAADRKAALLETVAALNPWIHRQAVRTGGAKIDGVRQKTTETVTYQVPTGRAILVPSLTDLDRQVSRAGASPAGQDE